MKRQRPSSHTRRIKTKKGIKKIKINRHIKKKPKKRSMAKITVFRGRRPGSEKGGFFATDELFARTYGPVEEAEIDLENPKNISPDEWKDSFGNWDIMSDKDKEKLKEKYTDKGYDSVVAEFKAVGDPIKVIWQDKQKKRSGTNRKNTKRKRKNIWANITSI